MKPKETITSFLISFFITSVFFYKSIFFAQVPFPGDLLLAEVKPWSTYSYQGYLPGTVPTKAQYPDVIRQLYPWRILAIDLMKAGKAPLWNPYNFSGSPLLANFQSAPFYPLNITFFFLPNVIAWTVLIFLQPMLAIWFTYLYARKIKLQHVASWFAAISYGFSSYMSVYLEYNTIGHVIIWFPLILLSVEHMRNRVQARWLGIFLFSLSSAALSGHPQLFAYTILFAWIYIFFRLQSKKSVVSVYTFSLLSLGIAAIAFIPGIELIKFAARSAHDPRELFTKLLIQPWQFIMLIFPNIFGNPATRSYWPADTYAGKVTSIGFIPLFFLPALWRVRKQQLVKFFLISAFTVILLITANPFTNILSQITIPLWSTSNPTLMVFLLCFALSIGVGFGVNQFMAEKHTTKKLAKRLISVATLFVLLFAALYIGQRYFPQLPQERFFVARRAVTYGLVLFTAICFCFFIAVVRPKLMQYALFLLLIVHSLDLWVSFQKFNPFVPKDFVFPPSEIATFLSEKTGVNRFWGYGTAGIGANIATALYQYSPDGYDPLYPRWYGELVDSSRDGQIHLQFSSSTRSDAMIVPGFGQEDLSSNLNRLRVLDTLGVRYVLDRFENATTIKTFPVDRYRLIYEKDGWKVFENLKAAPRVFIASDIQTYSDSMDFAKRFFDSSFDPAKNILLESLNDIKSFLTVGGSAKITSYLPAEVTIEATARSDSFLVLTDTYYPGWKAYVDNSASTIYKTDWALRAALVPKGNHTVIFRYEPDSYYWGVRISGVSLLIAIFTLIMISKRKNEKF